MSKALRFRTRTIGRLSVFAALVSAMTLGSGVSQAMAAGNVTSVVGSAYGYRAYGISLFGGAQPNTGPKPSVKLAADASNSPRTASVSTGLVQYGPAVLFTSDRIDVATSGSLGATGSVTSSTKIQNVNKATTQPDTGSEILTADNISSKCTKSASGSSRTTSITNGTLQTDSGLDANGDGDYTDSGEHPPVNVALPATPAANTTYTGHIHLSSTSQDDFKVVLRQHLTNADGSLTVNAVHEYFLGPTLKGHLILGRVVCGVTAS